MEGHVTADRVGRERALVTAAEWFAGGRRIPYDPVSVRIPDEAEVPALPGALRVFERVTGAGWSADDVWLTMLRRGRIRSRDVGVTRAARVDPHEPATAHASEIQLDIGGMTSASCAARIEKKLNRLVGVSASVTTRPKRRRSSSPTASRPPISSPPWKQPVTPRDVPDRTEDAHGGGRRIYLSHVRCAGG